MQRINFTETTLSTLKRNARCSFANAVYKLTMKAQQGLKCDDLFKKSVLMNEVNKLLCKYKLDECISFHPFQEGGISTWYFGIGSFTGVITYNLIIDGVETFIGSGSSVENIVIDINNNTEGTGVTAVLGEGGYFTIYSPAGCFIKADLTGSKDPEGTIPATLTTFTKGKCPQEETCVEYTEEELNCITPQDLQLLFEFTHKYKETLAKSTKRITSPSTSSSSPSPSDCCNWGSIGGSIGNQSDLITYLANIQKNYISIDNEGTEITNDVKSINFTGSGVNATYSGSGNVTVDIPGGGGGGFECADLEGCNISLLTNDAGYLTDISATNGLTESPTNNFKLGGTLIEDTTIYNDTFDFTVSRSDSGDSILGLNTSSGRGVVGSSVNSHGVVGLSTNGKGISGVSTNGVGVDASSGTSRAGQFGISPASNNSVGENIILYRNVASNAAGANGIGQSLIFASAASDANMYYTNTLVSKWTDATLATRTSQFIITTVNNAVSQDSLTINGDGKVIFNKYGINTFAGTPAYSLGVDASGNVIETTVSGGSQTLSQTLILGSTSGANDIQFDATQGLLFANTSRLREGTIDAGLGGTKGVAQICAVGYELKWEAGRLYVMDGNGLLIRQSLYNFNIPPTSTDDFNLGYAVGSLWTLDDGTVYECTFAGTLGGDAVWAIGGIPDLQQVTNVGFTTTNKLQSDDGAGNLSALNNGVIDLVTGLQTVTIDASLVTTGYNVSFPDKLTGAETFAMLSDIVAGSGDVVGPASAVDNNIATFDGTTGKLIQDGGTTIADINTNAVDKITVKLSESINKGQAVYISSANGTNIIVSKADNTSEATSSKTIGLLETSGATNAIVNVVISGLLDGLNTSTATIGDPVWLGTSGNLIFGLASKPYAPAHLVYIGVVSRVSATVGEILVKVQNGFELKEIHDVFAQSPAAKDGLFFDATTSLWKARPLVTADISNFVENLSLQDGGSSIAATTYTLELYAAYAYTINQLKIISASGTCTVAVKINGVDVTGISAVAVSSTIATGTATAANTVAIGDKITLVTTSNSALTNLQASLKTTRI